MEIQHFLVGCDTFLGLANTNSKAGTDWEQVVGQLEK